MRLLLPVNTTERFLAEVVLRDLPGDDAVYGCGPVALGESIDELVAEFLKGTFAGTIGLVITEDMVTPDHRLRSHVGGLMQLVNTPIVADERGMEWCLHLGFKAEKRGTWVGWAATKEQAHLAIGQSVERRDTVVEAGVHIVTDVGAAIACAILDYPCLILAAHPWGKTTGREYLPAVRWAKDAGVSQNIVWSREELEAKLARGEPARVSRDLVITRRDEAMQMLAEVQRETDPLKAALGPAVQLSTPPSRGRMLEIGSTFDPRTHYTEEYFGGSAGIHYMRPDGQWALYQSTAHEWEGFAWVARWLADTLNKLGPAGADMGSLLDLGCGSGDFVRRCVDQGIDGYGVDISEAAVARAKIKDRVFCFDITRQAMAALDRPYDVITALDLWEHIALGEIDALAEQVRKRMAIGGIGLFNICTRGDGEQDWTLEPPCQVTKENSWLLVSGHLTIRTWGWWAAKFEEHALRLNYRHTLAFNVARAEDPVMRGADSWSARNVLVVTRAE